MLVYSSSQPTPDAIHRRADLVPVAQSFREQGTGFHSRLAGRLVEEWRPHREERPHSDLGVGTAGLVVARQRPPTAAGFAFYVLEDGFHRVQAIINPGLWEAHRQLLRDAAVLIVQGVAQVNGRSVTLQVERLSGFPAPVQLASD